jgi:5-methyltetrahydrofolate--homocysteine methyltransferase
MSPLREAVAQRILVLDGAMGTMIQGAGLAADDFGGAQYEGCNEYLNLTRPDVIQSIHAAYFEAGADLVSTNTFGCAPYVLAEYGLAERAYEITLAAGRLAREAAGRRFVIGAMGPSTRSISVTRNVTFDEVHAAYALQAAALIAGGVDLIWIETMSHLSEIEAAIAGVRRVSPGIPIVATMTFDTRGHTMMGVSPETAVATLAAAGADAIGGNCGNGPDELLPVIEKMHAVAPDVVLVAKSNAGMPELVDLRAVYRAEPPVMAEAGLAFRDAGARIIGACCGSTPAHLAAMAEALGVATA